MLNGRCRMHGGLFTGAMASALSKAGIITFDVVPLEGSQRALIGALDREKGGVAIDRTDAMADYWLNTGKA